MHNNHRWAGQLDGRYKEDELASHIQANETDTKQKILTCDVLFIDEISMLSRKILGQLEYVCRVIHGNSDKLYVWGYASSCERRFSPAAADENLHSQLLAYPHTVYLWRVCSAMMMDLLVLTI